MTRQYYYRTSGCQALDSKDPQCTCWHDQGTGPFSDIKEGDTWRIGTPFAWRDKPEQKLTFEEVVGMFGNTLPLEALSIITNAPGDMPVSEVRNELTAMALRYKSSRLVALRSKVEAMIAEDQIASGSIDAFNRGIRHVLTIIDDEIAEELKSCSDH